MYSKVFQLYICLFFFKFFCFLCCYIVLSRVPCAVPTAHRDTPVLNHTHHSFLCPSRQRHPTPVLLPGKSHGWRSLVDCSPWGRSESDRTERLHFHFSPSCTGEGNGNPPQYSCLENPRDGGAWWAVVYGVAQSQTQLKRLSSSSIHRPWKLGLPR